MSPTTPPPVKPADGARAEATRAHIRGSNLLLFGRLISLGTNFLVNVLTVRYLSKSDYGAFGYALSVATTGASFLLLGMPRSIARFAPIYQERGDFPAMYGSLVLSTGLIATAGCLCVGLGALLPEPLLGRFIHDPLAVSLLLVLIALAPLTALDNLFQSMLAVFARPSAIFFRRHILGPLLKLGAVLLVVLCAGDVRFLAWAYLGASLVGLALYGPILKRALVKGGLWAHWDWRRLRFPAREVLSFGLSLSLAELLIPLRPTLAIVLLEHLRDTVEVADFRVFLPLANLNLIVLQSMKLLFPPVASRLFARGDHAAIDDLYWQTTIWISIITFPIIVPCIALAEPLTVFLYGRQYADTSAVLVVLALGEYINAAMGLNTYTLQVYDRVRYLVWTNLLATAVGLLLNLLLIPPLGALGAAVATAGALVLQNLMHHVGLQRFTEVELARWRYLRVYLSLGLAALSLFLIASALDLPVAVDLALVAAASIALLRLHRDTMDMERVFPELGRLPVLGWLLGVRRARPAG